jgi:hypothetical protein
MLQRPCAVAPKKNFSGGTSPFFGTFFGRAKKVRMKEKLKITTPQVPRSEMIFIREEGLFSASKLAFNGLSFNRLREQNPNDGH